MKRLAMGLMLLAGLPAIASAHTLAGDEGLFDKLGHQLLGSHHMPLTLLLLAGGIVIFHYWRKRSLR